MRDETINNREEGVILTDLEIEEYEEIVAPGFLLSA